MALGMAEGVRLFCSTSTIAPSADLLLPYSQPLVSNSNVSVVRFPRAVQAFWLKRITSNECNAVQVVESPHSTVLPSGTVGMIILPDGTGPVDAPAICIEAMTGQWDTIIDPCIQDASGALRH